MFGVCPGKVAPSCSRVAIKAASSPVHAVILPLRCVTIAICHCQRTVGLPSPGLAACRTMILQEQRAYTALTDTLDNRPPANGQVSELSLLRETVVLRSCLR